MATPYPIDGAPNSAIVEFTVTPMSSELQWPIKQKATAMATYDDGTTRDVSTTAVWSSSNVAVARADAGVIASEGAGSAVIQASLGRFQATTRVSVTVPTLAVLSYDGDRAGNIAGIDFFTANARGNTPPVRSIRGAATALGFRPYGMAVHSQELFVSCGDSPSGICVFPTAGQGNIAPTRHIVGNLTGLAPTIAFSVSDSEIVAIGNDAVLVFPSGGDGNIAPKRKISGAATRLSSVLSAVTAGDEIYAAEFSNQLIAVFPATANGNVAPVRTIEGASTKINSPIAAREFSGELYVLSSGNSISVYPSSAAGNAAPIRTIAGPNTKLVGAHVLTVVGELLFVANRDDTVLVFSTSDDGDAAPRYILGGPATHISNPTGLAFF